MIDKKFDMILRSFPLSDPIYDIRQVRAIDKRRMYLYSFAPYVMHAKNQKIGGYQNVFENSFSDPMVSDEPRKCHAILTSKSYKNIKRKKSYAFL